MRKIIPINDNWNFSIGAYGSHSKQTETVTLPHTWNAIDPFTSLSPAEKHILTFRRQDSRHPSI